MTITRRLGRAFGSFALVLAAAVWVTSAQAQDYELADIGVLPGATDSTAHAINTLGQVAGTSGESAFRYTRAAKEPLENVAERSPKGLNRGFGINASGVVVGDSTFGTPYRHAALFNNGVATELPTLRGSGAYSRANAINSQNWVVGFTSANLDQPDGSAFLIRAFERTPQMIDLGTLGGAHAQAWGINDSGYVTGNSELATRSGSTHAFLWNQKTGMVDLGTLAGDFSYGTFINESNHVVGYSTINADNDRVHAFLHDGSTMIDLGSLGGASMESDRSYALGVNSADEVVGYSYLPPGEAEPQQVAFVYRDGVMTDLNQQIGDAAKRYQLRSATAINEQGQITAIAFDRETQTTRGVLLTPAFTSGPPLMSLD